MVKPDMDTVVMVPAEPPAAGADRALGWPLDAGCAADATDEAVSPAESPIIGTSIAVANFFLVRNRRTFGADVDPDAGRAGSASRGVGLHLFMVSFLSRMLL
jgi:hypothetical protein